MMTSRRRLRRIFRSLDSSEVGHTKRRKEQVRTAAVIHRVRTHRAIIPMCRHNMRWEADPDCQDLQRSAFDKVKYSAILTRVSALGFGALSYACIRDFLTRRMAKLFVGELDLEERELGSVGTPQGSVISPLLFNIVMIKVTKRLEEQGRRPTWSIGTLFRRAARTIDCRPDVEEEAQDDLQEAVSAIEEELEGTGLICSPSKSELLVINPRRKEWNNLTVWTGEGQRIPPADKIRMLGLILDSCRRNTETINKLETKTNAAVPLIKRVANHRGNMREGMLMRLAQSFAINHLAYVAAYLNWTAAEKNKLNCMIRKVTNAEAMEALGVHNKFEEIVLAQQTAQMARLPMTKTGRAVLEKLNLGVQPPIMDANIPAETMRKLDARPIPRQMHPEDDAGRR
ncbi:hypothetical protein HPB47_006951 [Ixodes persulcatus]|uniref:Uncharacterized protein n=1 Tax=Ixodes persulcatus TaxID=34615 RepID=A0AC60P9C5_IXOPE|nr:hypothetical protein HPB47_006951 [Ixodes persulcatus]